MKDSWGWWIFLPKLQSSLMELHLFYSWCLMRFGLDHHSKAVYVYTATCRLLQLESSSSARLWMYVCVCDDIYWHGILRAFRHADPVSAAHSWWGVIRGISRRLGYSPIHSCGWNTNVLYYDWELANKINLADINVWISLGVCWQGWKVKYPRLLADSWRSGRGGAGFLQHLF